MAAIPTKKSETFSTAADSQPSVEVHVLQGERQMANDNRTLGRFHLDGIPPAPRGVPQIEVTFDIDANGIVNVSALDKATGKQQQITITASSGLNEDDIERMVSDAAEHEADDKTRRETVDTHNQLDAMIYNTEKLLSENKEKLAADDVSALESALEAGRAALEKNAVEEMKAAVENITQASHKMAEAMYKATSEAEASKADDPSATDAAPADDAAGGKNGVIDAEFEEAPKQAETN